MKKVLLLSILVLTNTLCAQQVVYDTVQLSTQEVTYITLGGFVSELDYGNLRYIETDNGKPAIVSVGNNSLVKLKASRKFKKTNILGVNDQGITYNITVYYTSNTPKNTSPFIGEILPPEHNETRYAGSHFNSIGNQEDEYEVMETDQLIAKQEAFIKNHKLKYDTIPYQKIAKILYSSQRYTKVKGIGVRSQGTVLKFENSWIAGDKLYFKFVLFNSNNKQFVIKNWQFKFQPNEGGLRRSSVTDQKISPLYEYKAQYQTVYGNQKLYKIFVFDNFGIATNEKFYVELAESGSNTILRMPLPSRYINRPRNAGKGVLNEKNKKKAKDVSTSDAKF